MVRKAKTGAIERRPASFYIAPEMKKELEELAGSEGRSVSSYICILIANALKLKKNTN